MSLISRRALCVATTAAGSISAFCLSAAGRSSHLQRLDWPAFVGAIQSATRRREKDGEWADACGRLSAALSYDDDFVLQRRRELSRGASPTSADLFRDATVAIVLFAMKKSDTLIAHDHPGMSVVTSCVSGALSVDVYKTVSADRDGWELVVKRITRQTLRRSDYSIVTAANVNIHAICAKDDAEFISIVRPPYDKMPSHRAHSYVLGLKDAAHNLFDATVSLQ